MILPNKWKNKTCSKPPTRLQMMLVIGDHQPEFVREKTSLTPPSRNHFHQAGSLSFCTVGCHHKRSSHPLALRRWGPPLGSGGLNLNTLEGPRIHQNPFDLDASQKRKHEQCLLMKLIHTIGASICDNLVTLW